MKSWTSFSRRQFMSSVAVSAAAACFPHKVSALMDDHLYVHGAFQQAPAPRPVADKIQFHAWAFPLDQVRLLDGPFLDAAKTNQAYLPRERQAAKLCQTARRLGESPKRGAWTLHRSLSFSLRTHLRQYGR